MYLSQKLLSLLSCGVLFLMQEVVYYSSLFSFLKMGALSVKGQEAAIVAGQEIVAGEMVAVAAGEMVAVSYNVGPYSG